MKRMFWLFTGVTVGLIAAKQIEKNPKTKAAYDEATAKLMSLVAAFTDGYDEELKPEVKQSPRSSTASKSAK